MSTYVESGSDKDGFRFGWMRGWCLDPLASGYSPGTSTLALGLDVSGRGNHTGSEIFTNLDPTTHTYTDTYLAAPTRLVVTCHALDKRMTGDVYIPSRQSLLVPTYCSIQAVHAMS